MSRQIGCDVDLVCAPSDRGWFDWLWERAEPMEQSMYDCLPNWKIKELPYNLSSLFPSVENPMQYWNDLDYDQFQPLEGSVDALERISTYFDIVFITQIEGGDHGKTKAKWLKKHYPFLKGIVYTKEKFVMNKAVDYMIDDRMSHLKGFEYQKRILFNTPYTQDVQCEVWKTMNSWKDIDEKFIKELL